MQMERKQTLTHLQYNPKLPRISAWQERDWSFQHRQKLIICCLILPFFFPPPLFAVLLNGYKIHAIGHVAFWYSHCMGIDNKKVEKAAAKQRGHLAFQLDHYLNLRVTLLFLELAGSQFCA